MDDPRVVTLANGAFAENCYIVIDGGSREAVMIDPGEEVDLFMRRLETERVDLRAVWLTHGHIDHIMGVAEVVRRADVPVYLHPADRQLYDSIEKQAEWLGVSAEAPPPPDFDLAAGQMVTVGAYDFDVREVPGHSPGSVAFVTPGLVISGDALFAGSIGRTDLPGGNLQTLLAAIERELLSLPDETVVYSGHGPATTIGAERRHNPFLTGAVQVRG